MFVGLVAGLWLRVFAFAVPSTPVVSPAPVAKVNQVLLKNEIAWGNLANQAYVAPELLSQSTTTLGVYLPSPASQAAEYLAGNNKCVTLDANGIPVVQYQTCRVDNIVPKPFYNPGTVAAFALGLWNLGGHNQQFLAECNWLVANQSQNGIFQVDIPIPMLGLGPGWASAMYQGEATSALLRAWQMTGNETYLTAAAKAIAPLTQTSSAVVKWTPYGQWPQEYAAPSPPSVLNGALTALFGLLDYQQATGKSVPAIGTFTATLNKMLPVLTVPGWAKYEVVGNDMASVDYMALQTQELGLFGLKTNDQTAIVYANLWRSDLNSESAAQERAANRIIPSGE